MSTLRVLSRCLCLIVGVLLSFGRLAASPETRPVINSVRLDGTNVVVTVGIPEGIQRVTIESRLRANGGAWRPRAVRRTGGAAGTAEFRIARSGPLELLRVRADEREPLPAEFYTGTNSFAGQPGTAGGLPTGFPGPEDPWGGDAGSDAAREVAESDIWKLQGDTLFFFNQYRGLQLIDVSAPDQATVTGTLTLPAAGEQMYLVGADHVVLLARDGCGWWGGDAESRVLVVHVATGTPRVVAELPLRGYIQESRIVGKALYVASQTYRVTSGGNGDTWEWGTVVSAFDLADPASPVVRNTLWLPGYGQVVSATDRFLFVSIQDPADWRKSVVHTVDISNPDGTVQLLNTLRPAGWVKDKFKLHVHGDVLTVVSEESTPTLLTKLETFSLADPTAPRKLGELRLGPSERLHATRFEGTRAYVVTFFVQFQMDPLWVIDLADPTRPAITGQLEIPGWSTYLHPLGDRLVAAGIETNRTTVSLFDVSNPAKPALLSRVALGSGWSWSEANADEKAFSVLPDSGLVLVPYQSWSETQSQLRVQLIDLFTNSLVARGAIEHTFTPRRATVHRDRVISVSGREFLSVDATDRDHPEVRATVDLAWSVDRVFVQGDHLIEVTGNGSGYWWGDGAEPPTLRVAALTGPERVLQQVELPVKEPIVGTAIRDGRLYVAQGRQDYFIDPAGETNQPPKPSLWLSIYDVNALPELRRLGGTEVILPPLGWGTTLQATWPRPGVLVLVGAGGGYWYPWMDFGMRQAGDAVSGFGRPGYWGGNGGRLIAFDANDPSAPRFMSDLDLATNNWWGFSAAYSANGLVHLSHQEAIPPEPIITCDASTGDCFTNLPPDWVWMTRSFLDVVDYADPADPLVREPVSLPGSLVGLGRGGELLYTVGPHWKPGTNWWNDGLEFLDASAYDGVAAHLIDSLELSRSWPHPVLALDPVAFIGRPAEGDGTTNSLETWTLSTTGKFLRVGRVNLPTPAQSLADFGKLLAVQGYDRTRLFDLTDPSAPVPAGEGSPAGCLWYDLRNADGTLDRGLWIPLGAHGVTSIPVFPR